MRLARAALDTFVAVGPPRNHGDLLMSGPWECACAHDSSHECAAQIARARRPASACNDPPQCTHMAQAAARPTMCIWAMARGPEPRKMPGQWALPGPPGRGRGLAVRRHGDRKLRTALGLSPPRAGPGMALPLRAAVVLPRNAVLCHDCSGICTHWAESVRAD